MGLQIECGAMGSCTFRTSAIKDQKRGHANRRKVSQRASLWDRNKMEELSSLSTPTSPRGGVNEEFKGRRQAGDMRRGDAEQRALRKMGVTSALGTIANTAKSGVVGAIGIASSYFEPSSEIPQSKVEEEDVPPKPVVNVKSFLRNESNQTQKLKRMRMLSSMSEQAYYVGTLTEADIWKRYGLNLVTSSLEYRTSKCNSSFSEEVDADAFSVFEDGDGMAVPISSLPEDRFRNDQNVSSIDEEAENVEATSSNLPADLVNTRMAAASKALEFATKNLTTFVSGYSKNTTKQESTASTSATDPCEWIVADDPNEPLRYIALQGSDSVDHWVTNLSFEPVDFEDKDSHVKIHSGVYKAADKLCVQLQAAILDHIGTHGEKARFIFTGHSLGGAIGIALVLLLVKRGVMHGSMLEGIYTYGCPAFIYDACNIPFPLASYFADENCCNILDELGINKEVIYNICMHRDIVPRAFACDYGSVRFILQQLEGFKNHGLLSGEDSKIKMETLYHHLGNVYFLQPDAEFLTFAKPEGDHPMFPEKSGLYKMVEPPSTLKMAMNTVNVISRRLQNEWAFGGRVDIHNYARDINHATVEILNNPHPLEILKDTGAYGHEGAVSRFHKPKNYTRALGALLYVKDD